MASSTLITSSVSASPSATRRSCASSGASLSDAALPMAADVLCVRPYGRGRDGKRLLFAPVRVLPLYRRRRGKSDRRFLRAAGGDRERAEGAAAAMRPPCARSGPSQNEVVGGAARQQVVPPAAPLRVLPSRCRSCGGRRMRRRRRRQVCDLARCWRSAGANVWRRAWRALPAAARGRCVRAACVRAACGPVAAPGARPRSEGASEGSLTCRGRPLPTDLAPDEQVFVIRVTGEVFRDYTCARAASAPPAAGSDASQTPPVLYTALM